MELDFVLLKKAFSYILGQYIQILSHYPWVDPPHINVNLKQKGEFDPCKESTGFCEK